MYFPELTRRCEEDYFNNRKKFYADYRKNYSKIAEDCQHRCVYCDITVYESGGDEMQLDHFRPQEHFEHLERHPHNLYLSCPKCNVLKTSDWPCCKNTDNTSSFIGQIGYLDRFKHKAGDFLRVEKDGTITQLAGPVNYMIEKMKLNRASRVNIRRKRKIESDKNNLIEDIGKYMIKLTQDCEQGKVTQPDMIEKMKSIQSLVTKFQSI